MNFVYILKTIIDLLQLSSTGLSSSTIPIFESQNIPQNNCWIVIIVTILTTGFSILGGNVVVWSGLIVFAEVTVQYIPHHDHL